MKSEHNSGRKIVRMTKSQRIQHVILFVSTTLLILTGFMLQADMWLIELFGDYGEIVFDIRSWLHRASGVIVSAVCIYHLIYVITTKEGKSWVNDMLPRIRDAVDAYQNVMFMIGFRKQKPKLERFMYLEKLEYWSVYFGMTIVIITGIMMWTEYLWPKFYLEVANALHLGEAVLATLAIIVGHIFSVHYNPHVYPVNRTFIDGMISEEMMKDEHELWYEREIKKSDEPAAGASDNDKH
jgi:cytochrome b subunit of formate dehydrogenase